MRPPSSMLRCSLFIFAVAFGSGTAVFWLGTSETWMDGGEVVDVSNFGRWFLFLSGFLIGGVEAVVVLVIATKYIRRFVTRVSNLGAVFIGAALGCIIGFSFCLVVSVLFFTFPFPHLWELMTEEHIS